MSWDVYGLVGWAALIASVAISVVCLVRGWRKERARGAARLCLATAIAAPILGLAGTYHGLLRAFGAVESADAASRATRLAEGISEAMNGTAFGLAAMLPPAIASAVLFLRAPSKRAH